jgi:hypothetical protein
MTTIPPPPVHGSFLLPGTLAGGHGASFYMELAQLKQAVARADTGEQPRAFVRLATDKRVYSDVVKLAG